MVEFLRTRLLRASARQPLGRSCPARRIFTAVQDHAHTLPLVEVWKFLLMTVVVAYVSGPYTCTWNLHLKRPQSSQRIVGGAGQPGMHATYAYLVRPPSKAVSRCSLLLRSQARDSAGVRMRVGSAIGDTLGSRSSNKGCARPPSADEHPTPQVTMEKATKRYRLVVDRQADVEHYVACFHSMGSLSKKSQEAAADFSAYQPPLQFLEMPAEDRCFAPTYLFTDSAGVESKKAHVGKEQAAHGRYGPWRGVCPAGWAWLTSGGAALFIREQEDADAVARGAARTRYRVVPMDKWIMFNPPSRALVKQLDADEADRKVVAAADAPNVRSPCLIGNAIGSSWAMRLTPPPLRDSLWRGGSGERALRSREPLRMRGKWA